MIRPNSNTELCISISSNPGNFGNNFHPFVDGLPGVPVHDLVIHPRENDLIVGTHGRSVYIANISSLQNLNDEILNKKLHIFEIESLNYSSRWGTQSWNGIVIEPSIDIVLYSKFDSKINLVISKGDNELIKKSFSITKGLNFINNNLFIDSENKYLDKGEYTVKIGNLDSTSETKFIIK